MILSLYLFWLLLNQKVTLEICLFGIVIVGAVSVFLCKYLDYSLKKEWKIWRSIPLGFAYLILLILEILKANLGVAKIVLHGKDSYQPAIVQVRVPLKNSVLRAIYANSITITPGTITVGQEEDLYTVHCLDRAMGEGLDDTRLVKLLQKMEDHA